MSAALLLPGVDPLPSDPAARVRASSAWYTPPEAAAEVAAFCGPPELWNGARILEPSVGGGALLAAMLNIGYATTWLHDSPSWQVDAIDLDRRACDALRDRLLGVTVYCDDYLTRPAPAEPYDLAVLNPPYEKGQDSAFVAKAMDESLRVVALVRLAMLESARSYERVWSRVESGEWRMPGLRVFSARPAFMPGGEESDGGKTAFALVKLSRISVPVPTNTIVGWVRP